MSTRGDSEDVITQAFVQEFGTKVYAEPPKSGLSLVAWSLPSVYLLLGTGIVIFVIFRWRARQQTRNLSPSTAPARETDTFSNAVRMAMLVES